MNSPCPIHSGQGGPKVESVRPDADHQRAEHHGPARADAVGDAAHHDAADAGAEPGERDGERRDRARAADFGGDVFQRHRGDPGGAERHRHDAQRDARRRPRTRWLSIDDEGDCNIERDPADDPFYRPHRI